MSYNKNQFPILRMTAAAFAEKVRTYSHLPGVFLQELAKAADRIAEADRIFIITELDRSAEAELNILAEGYRIIAEAEKKIRKEVEGHERTQEMSAADLLFTKPSTNSL